MDSQPREPEIEDREDHEGTEARPISPVDFFRVRRAIRPARGFYALISAGTLALGAAGLVSDGVLPLYQSLPSLGLGALFTAAFFRVYRDPLFWTRLAAWTATGAVVVAYGVQGWRGDLAGFDPHDAFQLLMQAGIVAAFFDAIPGPDAARWIRDEPQTWARYLETYS